MPEVNIARRIEAGEKVKKFKILITSQMVSLANLFKQLKREFNSEIPSRFDLGVKSSLSKIFLKKIPVEKKREFANKLSSISKQVKEWDLLSEDNQNDVLLILSNLEREYGDIVELNVLVEIIRLLIEVTEDVKELKTNLSSLSGAKQWEQLRVYAELYEEASAKGKFSSAKSLANLGNPIIGRISGVLIKSTTQLNELIVNLDLLREKLGDNRLLNFNKTPMRRIGDVLSINQKLFDFNNDLSNDIKHLPLFEQ